MRTMCSFDTANRGSIHIIMGKIRAGTAWAFHSSDIGPIGVADLRRIGRAWWAEAEDGARLGPFRTRDGAFYAASRRYAKSLEANRG